MRALDLFCGGGGAALGLIEAGFEVTGVDIEPRHAKVYPGRFVVGDACRPPFRLLDFDLVWASPPCQRFSAMTTARNHRERDEYPDLIGPVRELLAGHPWTVIENVPRAPIRCDLVLTGPMVGLPRIARRRHFELSWFPGLQPQPTVPPSSDWRAGKCLTITKSLCAWSHYYARKRAGLSGRPKVAEAREVMGITTSMTAHQVGEAVPPPYSAYIGALARDAMAEA